jgi:hypothetical protein
MVFLIMFIFFVIWGTAGGFEIVCMLFEHFYSIYNAINVNNSELIDILINNKIDFTNSKISANIDLHIQNLSKINTFTLDEATKLVWEAIKNKSYDSKGNLLLKISIEEYQKNDEIFKQAASNIFKLIKQYENSK